jgi:hypothetical protein
MQDRIENRIEASPPENTGVLARLQAAGGDLKDPRWIYFKGFLFLLSGILAAGLLLFEHPTWKDAALLALAIWCFCRFYYFAFYVIEHYVDDEYKFAGLWSFVRYLMRR